MDHREKGFLLLFQNQNGGVRRQNHQSVVFCVFFPPPEWETERQRYGLAAASTTESANTKIVGTEDSVARLSIIKRNKTSP